MGRNEIRLRRNRMTGKGSDRFRNYGDVLHRHEREMRMKKILRVFTFLLIILILISLIFFIGQIEQKVSKKKTSTTEKIIKMKS